MKRTILKTVSLAAIITVMAPMLNAHAGEIGHFNGGVMNIRDYVVPEPGFYGAIYNYFYTTGQLNNSNGDEIKSVTIKPGPGPAGYDTWQITGDSGSAASTTRDQAHAVGGQLGLTYLPWFLSVNLHGFHEYFAEARFQGGSLGVSIAKKF